MSLTKTDWDVQTLIKEMKKATKRRKHKPKPKVIKKAKPKPKKKK